MILDGKMVKDKTLFELRKEVSKLNIKPKLVVIQIGNSYANDVYIKQKNNMCFYVGYDFECITLNDDTNTEILLELIRKLNNDNSVTGILVQLPLPGKIDKKMVVNAISPSKDVDGLTDINNIRLLRGDTDVLCPCTSLGVMELLSSYQLEVSGKHVVIVGRSDMIGKSLCMMMLNKDATVTICHSKTENLCKYTRIADILVVAVGKPNFITGDMVSEDTIVIDVGINKTNSGLCGDVNFKSVCNKVKYISLVPGGVGPMTVTILAKNILKAYKLQNDKRN